MRVLKEKRRVSDIEDNFKKSYMLEYQLDELHKLWSQTPH